MYIYIYIYVIRGTLDADRLTRQRERIMKSSQLRMSVKKVVRQRVMESSKMKMLKLT